jgi:hypothetical protein
VLDWNFSGDYPGSGFIVIFLGPATVRANPTSCLGSVSFGFSYLQHNQKNFSWMG